MIRTNVYLFGLLVLLLTACDEGSNSSSSISTSNTDNSPTTTNNPTTTIEPTLASIQSNVFTPTCAVSGCHASPGAADLILEEGQAFTNLVGVDSTEVNALKRIAPGDPDNSYLIQKIEGTAAIGARMPRGRTPLTDDVIKAIRQWISNGALATSNSSTSQMSATLVSPVPNTKLSQPPSAIHIAFNQEVDATELNTATVSLQAAGGDKAFNEGNEKYIEPHSIYLSSYNPYVAILDLRNTALSADRYRLHISGSGDAVVMNIAGIIIDGNHDNIPGGDFYADFSVISATP